MPKDCYISESGNFNGCVVRKSSYGVEVKAGFDEVRYVIDPSPEALKQAWELHTCNYHLDMSVTPFELRVIPKPQEFVMVECL